MGLLSGARDAVAQRGLLVPLCAGLGDRVRLHSLETADHGFKTLKRSGLTTEDVLNICDRLKPDGVIVQFGGQTPLNLARGLEASGVTIIGTSPDMIDAAEDRGRFQSILRQADLRQPANGIATNVEQARTEADQAEIGRAHV